jgi:hypothetical protein
MRGSGMRRQAGRQARVRPARTQPRMYTALYI